MVETIFLVIFSNAELQIRIGVLGTITNFAAMKAGAVSDPGGLELISSDGYLVSRFPPFPSLGDRPDQVREVDQEVDDRQEGGSGVDP